MAQRRSNQSIGKPGKRWIEQWQATIGMMDSADKISGFRKLHALDESGELADMSKTLIRLGGMKNKSMMHGFFREESRLSGAMTRPAAYLLAASCYSFLDTEINTGNMSYLSKEDIDMLGKLLQKTRYSENLYDRMRKQSTMINAVGDVLHYHRGVSHKNWDNQSLEDRGMYLSLLSDATNYALRHTMQDRLCDEQHVYTTRFNPSEMPVHLVIDVYKGKNVFGHYGNSYDRINVQGKAGFSDTMQGLQREKARQMSALERKLLSSDRSAVDWVDHGLYEMQTNIFSFVRHYAGEAHADKIRELTPEERFVKAAEFPVPVDRAAPELREHYRQNLEQVFAKSHTRFDYMRQSLYYMGLDLKHLSEIQGLAPKL